MKRIAYLPDPALVLFALIATVMGLFFVFDAGYARSIGSKEGSLVPPEFRSQLMFLLPSLLAGFCCSQVKEGTWRKAAPWLFCLVLLMLVAVTKFGVRENGAQRWLGIGSFTVQPAEFAKIASIVYLASMFASRKPRPRLKPNRGAAYWLDNALVPTVIRAIPGLMILVVAMLIDHEKDLGTAGVIGATAFLMFIPAGVSTRSMLLAVGLCVMGACYLVKQEPYRLERIENHQNRWASSNVDDDSFQTVQSELAMASGGSTGVGIGNGRAKQVIPATTTDFVMATVAEEFGLVGALAVMAALGCLVWRLMLQASRATSKFSGLVLYGIGAWIGVQTCVNVLMANGTFPAIGIPLPFISSGGSSLVALWCAIGVAESAIAASALRRTPSTEEQHERAVVSPRAAAKARVPAGSLRRA